MDRQAQSNDTFRNLHMSPGDPLQTSQFLFMETTPPSTPASGWNEDASKAAKQPSVSSANATNVMQNALGTNLDGRYNTASHRSRVLQELPVNRQRPRDLQRIDHNSQAPATPHQCTPHLNSTQPLRTTLDSTTQLAADQIADCFRRINLNPTDENAVNQRYEPAVSTHDPSSIRNFSPETRLQTLIGQGCQTTPRLNGAWAQPVRPSPPLSGQGRSSWITNLGPDSEYNRTPAYQSRDDVAQRSVSEASPLINPWSRNVSAPTSRVVSQVRGIIEDDQEHLVVGATREPHPNHFHPMTVLRDGGAPGTPSHSLNLQHRVLAGLGFEPEANFSSEYHGIHNVANASANIPDDDNCSLWLTKLPPNVTYSEVIAMITHAGPFGRVYCIYVNYPDNVKHHTAAAKVVFFTPEAAQRLLRYSWSTGLYVGAYRIIVTHNRIKSRAVVVSPSASRVLIITGHVSFVNEKTLMQFYEKKFIFQLDRFIDLITTRDRAVVELRFGSYRCQSQMGKMALERERPEGFEKAEFGDDPCEHGENYSSYGIAAERIQGKGI